jgi:hypothetical protein
MQDGVGDVRHWLDTHLAGGGMKQGKDLGRTGAHVLMRLAGRLALRLPTAAGVRHGLERPGFVLAPHRQAESGAAHVRPLDQGFFPTASGSWTTTTAPCLRLRTAIPVAHQVRLCCQLIPAPCGVCQIV